MKKSLLLLLFISQFAFSQVPSYVPTNGLKSWYPFSGNANDLGVSSLNGTVVGATLTNDRNGNANSAYSFTTNQQINIPNSATSNYYPITISLWYNASALTSGVQTNLFSKYVSSSWNGYQILFGDNRNISNNGRIENHGFGTQSWYLRSTTNKVIGFYGESAFLQPNISVNTWYHYVFVLDSTGGKIYVNGQLVSTHNWTGTPGSCTNNFLWKIGGQYDSSAWYNGKIDDLGIWNRALTRDEVQQLYTSCTTVAPTGNANLSLCLGSTVANLTATGTNLKWYAAATGGTALAPTTALVSGRTYYASQTVQGCESVARLAVTPSLNYTVTAASSSPTLCINTALTTITHTTTIATGIGTVTGLPAGVFASWFQNTITIRGTPTTSGTFNYRIPTTGGCGDVATGTIIVRPNNTVTAASSMPTLCINTQLTPITHSTTGATGIGTVTGLPSGITVVWIGNTITVSGTPTVSGTFNYSIPLTGGCGTVNANGTIIVNPNSTAPTGASTQTFCTSPAPTVASLTATGANIKWYAAATGGTPLAATNALVNGTTYYASQTDNGCESTSRLAVTVSVNNPTVSASSSSICVGQSTTLTVTGVSNSSGALTNLTGPYYFNGHTYFKSINPLSWSQSEQNSISSGGHLLIPNSLGEINFIIQNIYNNSAPGIMNIGITDVQNEGIWLDVLGNQLSYTNWDVGEPNNLGGNEDYGLMYSSGKWNDGHSSNNQLYPYVVEFDRINTYLLWSTGATTASINVTPTVTTTYWVDVTTNGVTCRKSFTITVNPNVTPTFTPIAAICNGGTLAPLPTTSTNNITGTWSPVLNNTATTTYTFRPTAGLCALSTTMTITVNTIPATPTGSAAQTLCSPSTIANLTATGANIKWYTAATGGTPLAATTALVNGTTYYASQTVQGCESSTRFAVIVSVNNPTVSASAATLCSGQTTTLTASPGASTTSNFSVGSIGPAGGYVFYDQGSIINGWRYLEVAPVDFGTPLEWGCDGTNISGTSTSVGTGQANTNLIIQNCSSINIAARACDTAVINGFSDWYLPSKDDFNLIYQNLNPLGIGNFINSNGNQWNRYWTSSQIGAYAYAHDFTPYYQQITQKVNQNKVRPIRQFATGAAVSTYLWSTGATTASINVTPTVTTTYWVDVTTNGVTCRKSFTITVIPDTAPTGSATQTLCSASTVSDLAATGSNIKWYAAATGGTALASTTLLVSGTTYYATQTVQGCESSNRFGVVVSLNNPQITASSTTICGGTSVNIGITNAEPSLAQFQAAHTDLTLFHTIGSHAYFYKNQAVTWPQAKAYGDQIGVSLYVINDAAEELSVYNSLPFRGNDGIHYWIGLFQDLTSPNYSEPSGGWKWVDNTPFQYSNWGAGEPNNSFSSGENFAQIEWDDDGIKWNDAGNAINSSNCACDVSYPIYEFQSQSTYVWSTGETSATINPSPNQTTTYWVDVTTNGVTCRKFITVNVNTNIAPSINVTTQSSCTTPSGSVQVNSPISGGITPQNLFISEITDATTGALVYIELFNKTGNTVNLSNYKIKVYNNGGINPTCVSVLSGSIANNSTYVIKLSDSNNANGITPNLTLLTCAGIDIDDNIRLTNLNDIEIDIWGRTDGIAFTPNNQTGYTYRRHSNAILPSTTWSPVDWDEIAQEEYSNIGTYVFPTNNLYNYSVDGGAYQTSTIFTGLSVGNHTITVKDMNSGCTASTTFTIQSASVVPTGNITQTFCSGATVSNLVANGTTIKWYLSSTGGTALSSTALLLNNTNYFATQTINGCESQTRLEVKVTLVDVQISTPNTTVCPGGSTTLTATDLNNLASANCLNVSAQIRNGLQAFYPFCGTANDISGNSLNGNVVGATLTSDRFGNLNSAYSFVQNQQISIPNTSGRNTYPLTISLWYNTATVSDGQGQNGRSIFTKYTPAAWNGFGIGLFDYSNEGQGIAAAPLYLRNTSNRVIGLYNEAAFNQSNVRFNTWYHVVFTLDASGGKMYLNGQLIATHNWTGTAGPSNSGDLWKIGGKWNYWFNGKIDDVAIWNRVLSPIEVQEIHGTPMTTSTSTFLWSTGATTPTISVNPSQTTEYSVAVTTNGVTCTKRITITVLPTTPAPTGANNYTMTQGATLANIAVTGQNILWYSTPFGGTPLPLNTPLVSGVTYYASQTINGCESPFRLPVLTQIELGNDDFNSIKIVYSPNPVTDILTINASIELKAAKICNLLGQTIKQQRFNSNEIQLNMSELPSGTYLIIVEADDRKETFKILKK
jgi:hypothetical protein